MDIFVTLYARPCARTLPENTMTDAKNSIDTKLARCCICYKDIKLFRADLDHLRKHMCMCRPLFRVGPHFMCDKCLDPEDNKCIPCVVDDCDLHRCPYGCQGGSTLDVCDKHLSDPMICACCNENISMDQKKNLRTCASCERVCCKSCTSTCSNPRCGQTFCFRCGLVCRQKGCGKNTCLLCWIFKRELECGTHGDSSS